uniref:DUF4806 domain-containing protein n=1 Tax=Anopheles stephensi TaxID=30069 RepID=A0A182YFL9_ANOST
MNAKYPVVHIAGSTQTAASQGRAHGAVKTANCTHCACFDKFVSDHNRKVDQFLVKQQKVVNDMFKLQRAIMERLQSIEGNLERQSTQLQQASVSEQPDESPQTPIHPNDFVQLQYVAHHRTPPEEQQNEPQHHHHHHQLGEYPDEVQLFSFTRMQSEEELNEFEKRLGDSEYFKEAYNWLNSLIMETNCGNRMLAALDLMFDKVFVNQCSWTGRCKGNARKAPIRCRRNLLQLFKAIGSTRKAIVSRADVEVFFIKKLKQSKQRLNIQGVRKSTCHMKRVHVD